MVPTTEMVAPGLAVAGAVAVTSMSAYGFTPRVTAGAAVTSSPASLVAWTVTSPRLAVGQEVGTGAAGSKWRATVMVAFTDMPNVLFVGEKGNGSLMVQVGVFDFLSKPLGRVQPLTETKSTSLGQREVQSQQARPGLIRARTRDRDRNGRGAVRRQALRLGRGSDAVGVLAQYFFLDREAGGRRNGREPGESYQEGRRRSDQRLRETCQSHLGCSFVVCA